MSRKTDGSRFAKPGREMLSVMTTLVNVMIYFGLFCLVIFLGYFLHEKQICLYMSFYYFSPCTHWESKEEQKWVPGSCSSCSLSVPAAAFVLRCIGAWPCAHLTSGWNSQKTQQTWPEKGGNGKTVTWAAQRATILYWNTKATNFTV